VQACRQQLEQSHAKHEEICDYWQEASARMSQSHSHDVQQLNSKLQQAHSSMHAMQAELQNTQIKYGEVTHSQKSFYIVPLRVKSSRALAFQNLFPHLHICIRR
jgi:hypothetical protein